MCAVLSSLFKKKKRNRAVCLISSGKTCVFQQWALVATELVLHLLKELGLLVVVSWYLSLGEHAWKGCLYSFWHSVLNWVGINSATSGWWFRNNKLQGVRTAFADLGILEKVRKSFDGFVLWGLQMIVFLSPFHGVEISPNILLGERNSFASTLSFFRLRWRVCCFSCWLVGWFARCTSNSPGREKHAPNPQVYLSNSMQQPVLSVSSQSWRVVCTTSPV